MLGAWKKFAFGLLGVVVVSPAWASFTTINPPPFGDDRHDEIFNGVLTGQFHATGVNNRDYTNGTITAVRVEDIYTSGTPTSPLATSENVGNDDQVWKANYRLASAEVVFGVYKQEFGYFLGSSGGSYQKLFSVNGYDYNVTEAVGGINDISFLSGQTLRWARGGENRVFSSRNADNGDNVDHLVTYRIDGLNDGKLTWLLFWEDKFVGENLADFDFNDEVVKITAVPTPEPTGVAAAALGLIGLAARRKRD